MFFFVPELENIRGRKEKRVDIMEKIDVEER